MFFELVMQGNLYAICLVIVAVLCFLELLSFIISLDFLEGLTPPDIDIDLDLDIEVSWLAKCFSWLNIGGIPFLIIMIISFFFFGAIGLILQTKTILPGISIFPITLFSSIILVKGFFKIFKPFIPKDETEVINKEDLVGREGVITRASSNGTAETKVTDRHGRNHWILINSVKEEFFHNQKVTIIFKHPDKNLYDAS